MRLLVFLSMLMISVPLYCQAGPDTSLTINLAQSHVDITTAFSGTDITLYGVMENPGDVIVVVRGPKKDMVVRQKQSVFGAWMNHKAVSFKDVYGFYCIISSKGYKLLLSEETLKENVLGISSVQKNLKTVSSEKDKDRLLFSKALVRNKKYENLYTENEGEFSFLNDNFFRADLHLPANVPVGIYDVATYYIENKKIKNIEHVKMKVAQTGMSQDIKLFSQNSSLVYGLICVMLAVFSGWFSNRVRRRS